MKKIIIAIAIWSLVISGVAMSGEVKKPEPKKRSVETVLTDMVVNLNSQSKVKAQLIALQAQYRKLLVEWEKVKAPDVVPEETPCETGECEDAPVK